MVSNCAVFLMYITHSISCIHVRVITWLAARIQLEVENSIF